MSWDSELLTAIERVLADFKCRVDFSRPGTGGAAIDVEIVPDNSVAARVWVNGSPGDVYLLMGAGCGVELGDTPVVELVSIIKAVAEGGFSERVWYNRNGQVHASIGTLEIGGAVRKFRRNRFRDGSGGRTITYPPFG